jgi:hypothetical protein
MHDTFVPTHATPYHHLSTSANTTTLTINTIAATTIADREAQGE